jgi:hypothetical protein
MTTTTEPITVPWPPDATEVGSPWTDRALTDMGPATQPPSWFTDNGQMEWGTKDGTRVCFWGLDLSDDVWVSAEDRVVDGRLMRSATEVKIGSIDISTAPEAFELARAINAALDIIADEMAAQK